MDEILKQEQKIIASGDGHSKFELILPRLEVAIEKENPDTIVFMGDNVDDWNASAEDNIRSLTYLADWIDDKKDNINIVCLLGNHDMQYKNGTRCSGTNLDIRVDLLPVMERLNLQGAYAANNILFTHAGLTRTWADHNGIKEWMDIDMIVAVLNETANRYPDAFDSCGQERGGKGYPGPLWAGQNELLDDCFVGINQVVGHTPVRRTFSLPVTEDDGTKYFLAFCDSMSLMSDNYPIGNGDFLISRGKNQIEPMEMDSLMAECGLASWKHAVNAWFAKKQNLYIPRKQININDIKIDKAQANLEL